MWQAASSKYKSMVQAGTWNAPSPEDEKILALEAKIQQLQKEKKPKKPKNDPKDMDAKKPGKGKKKCYAKLMKVPPADADKDKPKMVNGNKFFWCSKHGRWGGHTASECKGVNLDNEAKKLPAQTPPSPQTQTCLKLDKALTTIVLSDSK